MDGGRAPLTATWECGWRSVMAGMSRFLPEKKEISCRKTRSAFVQTAPAPETPVLFLLSSVFHCLLVTVHIINISTEAANSPIICRSSAIKEGGAHSYPGFFSLYFYFPTTLLELIPPERNEPVLFRSKNALCFLS